MSTEGRYNKNSKHNFGRDSIKQLSRVQQYFYAGVNWVYVILKRIIRRLYLVLLFRPAHICPFWIQYGNVTVEDRQWKWHKIWPAFSIVYAILLLYIKLPIVLSSLIKSYEIIHCIFIQPCNRAFLQSLSWSHLDNVLT